MHNDNIWELPFSERAQLELQTEWGQLSLVRVEPGGQPRVELTQASGDHVSVQVDKIEDVVRVRLDPHGSMNWFGGWECRAVAYVPRDVQAAVLANAGSVSVRNLDGCELDIRTNAGKIDLVNVYGRMHLSADAGSVNGRELGGSFDVETHAGSVRLEVLDLQPGEHRIRATMGSVRLELARGLDVCVETHTALGSIRNGVPIRADAPAKLVLSTEMGSIRVSESNTFHVARPRTRPVDVPKHPSDDGELVRILKMVEAGELSAQDADELLRAMDRV